MRDGRVGRAIAMVAACAGLVVMRVLADPEAEGI
jgi:hypothetical protein